MRWLSLESAVSRILSNYAGRKVIFLAMMTVMLGSDVYRNTNPMTEVHLLFYQAVLQQFVNCNKFYS